MAGRQLCMGNDRAYRICNVIYRRKSSDADRRPGWPSRREFSTIALKSIALQRTVLFMYLLENLEFLRYFFSLSSRSEIAINR